ncbi:MAG: glycosyltransferase family 1 protein [Patescibacteria group bacterium]|nr:glycosyltransferase family 1 protein [Patescibacteria group bacterium]
MEHGTHNTNLFCSMLHAPCSMTIGIDASRAFQKNKTGIEEYSFQVIKNLRNYLRDDQVILYLNPAINIMEYPDPVKSRDAGSRRSVTLNGVNFDLPENWRVKYLRAPIFWTQARLSLEMLFRPVDALFVPAHTVPLVHPRNTIVTIHGLEYEFCPEAYSFFDRLYMRWSIKKSCKWAKAIIAVSNNTKKDLEKLYNISENKIKVIYEGYGDYNFKKNTKYQIPDTRYLLFVGRLEERKNICGMVEAFEILKEKYNLPHKLFLAGKFGYGEKKIKCQMSNVKSKGDIILAGYISDEEKFELMKKADVFLFPTFYEGFGLPILEAQNAGTPVITSNISSMPEVAGDSAVLVDPKNTSAIAEAIHKLVSDESYKNDIIKKGLENVKRFSWEKCAKEIAEIIIPKV